MTEWYTIKQYGGIQAQTNHRYFRVLIGDTVAIQPSDDIKAIMSILNDWKAMIDSEGIRWSMMNMLANRLNVPYETIYRAFYA